MFRISSGKGFQMTFENGWTVSVQFGNGNYCENRFATDHERGESVDAEIAAWDKNNVWHDFGHDTVMGWCTADQVADFIAEIKGKPRLARSLN